MTYGSQASFGNYDPSSFGWSRSVDLVPFQFGGVDFGECARAVRPVFVAVLTELVPHIPGGLKAGSCWAYAATDDLPDGSWSFHHYGIAMDLNWNVNHMGTNIPDASGEWALPRAITSAIAAKYGCEWGGNWGGGFHDLMHIECHLTPAVARAVRVPAPNVKPVPIVLEDDMPRILTVDRKDCARLKVTWPGIFLYRGDGTIAHIPNTAAYQAHLAAGCTQKTISVAQYRALGGK